jgi:hypothetical protein
LIELNQIPFTMWQSHKTVLETKIIEQDAKIKEQAERLEYYTKLLDYLYLSGFSLCFAVAGWYYFGWVGKID